MLSPIRDFVGRSSISSFCNPITIFTGQHLAKTLREIKLNGIVNDSHCRVGGQCVAVFRHLFCLTIDSSSISVTSAGTDLTMRRLWQPPETHPSNPTKNGCHYLSNFQCYRWKARTIYWAPSTAL